MKKLLGALVVVAFALGGCQTASNMGAKLSTMGSNIGSFLSTTSITQDQIDVLRESYDTAFLIPATNYRALGICAKGVSATIAKPCADRAVVIKLQAADNAIEQDFNSVQALVTAGDASNAQLAYATLNNAINTAETLIASTGVK